MSNTRLWERRVDPGPLERKLMGVDVDFAPRVWVGWWQGQWTRVG